MTKGITNQFDAKVAAIKDGIQDKFDARTAAIPNDIDPTDQEVTVRVGYISAKMYEDLLALGEDFDDYEIREAFDNVMNQLHEEKFGYQATADRIDELGYEMGVLEKDAKKYKYPDSDLPVHPAYK